MLPSFTSSTPSLTSIRGVAPLSSIIGQMVQLLPLFGFGAWMNNSPEGRPVVRYELVPANSQRLTPRTIRPPLFRVSVVTLVPLLKFTSPCITSEFSVAELVMLVMKLAAPVGSPESQFWVAEPVKSAVWLLVEDQMV